MGGAGAAALNPRTLGSLVLVGLACAGCKDASKPVSADPSPPAPVACASAPAPPASAPPPAGAKLRVIEAPVDEGALSTIRTARLQSKATGRVLVVFVSATWCDPCKQLKAEIQAGRLDARLSKIDLFAFDADRDGDRLRAAGYSFAYVPFVALPGADGGPADSQQATGHGGGAWRELLGKLDAWQRGG